MSGFRVIEHKGNKTGSLPAHFDILAPGSDESIITVWERPELAHLIVKLLEKSATGGHDGKDQH